MKSNKGFTLIELLAVIVILAIVTVIGITTVLPYMTTARESAFRTEATEVVKSAKTAINLYKLNQIDIPTSPISGYRGFLKDSNSERYCFTVQSLIDLGIYDGDKNAIKGGIVIDLEEDSEHPYTLYLKKNEFQIYGGHEENYKDKGDVRDTHFWIEPDQVDCRDFTLYI